MDVLIFSILADDLGLEGLYQCWDQSSDTNFLEVGMLTVVCATPLLLCNARLLLCVQFWAVSVPEWICANVLSSSINTCESRHAPPITTLLSFTPQLPTFMMDSLPRGSL